MSDAVKSELVQLIKNEGWEIVRVDDTDKILAYGKTFPFTHPWSVICKLYREETIPQLKYTFLKRMHDMLWPNDLKTWHAWSQTRFENYCEPYKTQVWASGSSGGKSVDAAKLSLLEWFSAPNKNGVIVASTTLNSLQARIYGYILSYLRDLAIKLPYTIMRSQPPRILFERDNEINCISAIPCARGTDSSAIRNYLGRHPKGKLLLVLDEAVDLDPCILGALPNLEAGEEGKFKCLAIGNSQSKFDLHGALATPAGGWKSVDIHTPKWETATGGLCLFFSCYDSPAITEQDPVKKAALSKFLITKERVEEAEKEYGKDSDSFLRFTLGFWRSEGGDDVVISEPFINEYHVKENAEFSGLWPIQILAGLDPAFSYSGDKCILRFAILGQDTSGKMVLDFRGSELIYDIKLSGNAQKSVELQIADRVIELLNQYNCSLAQLCVDTTGAGRALAEVIKLRAQSLQEPIRMWSSKFTPNKADKNQTLYNINVKSTLELWTDIRSFIQTDQIRGLDLTTIRQLTSRLVIMNPTTLKRTLESKQDYKVRMGAISPLLAHSPDEADSVAMCVQAAKIRFGFTPGQRREINKQGFTLQDEKWWVSLNALAEEESHKVTQPPIGDFSSDIYDTTSGGDFSFKPFNDS